MEKTAVKKNFLKKIFGGVLAAILIMNAAPSAALDFELTPAAEELFREYGSVGHLYWGRYKGF